MINFAVIGAGSFGLKRARAIIESDKGELVGFYDTNKEIITKTKKDLKQICNNFFWKLT